MTKSRSILPPRRPWTSDEIETMRINYADFPTALIALLIDRSELAVYEKASALGLRKSAAFFASQASGRLMTNDRRGAGYRFQPRHVPANKGLRRPGWAPGRMRETQFKKGCCRSGKAALLYKPIGSERLSKEGYLERKVNDDMPLQQRWRGVHLLLWEEANGPIPKGHCIAFRDGDKRNITLDNLQLITRADNMCKNTIHRYPPELKKTIRAVGKLRRAIAKRETA